MNDHVKLFGRRNGPNLIPPLPQSKTFGKRRSPVAVQSGVDGQRPASVTDFRTVATARLTGICSDLVNLYADPASIHDELCFRVVGIPEPKLSIGDHASVHVNDARGTYILTIESSKPGFVTIETGSDDLLLDYIMCHLALDRARYCSVTSHGLASLLVGSSLEDVERSLILATLRQHHFNRTRSAEVLGISVRTIRSKLRSYRDRLAGSDTTSRVFSLRRSPPPD